MTPSRFISYTDCITASADKTFLQALKRYGFTDLDASHGHILRELLEVDSCSCSEMAKRVHRTKANLTVALKKLESNGYVTRVRDPHDARQINISITDKGRLIQPVLKEVEDFIAAEYTKGLTPEEVEAAERFMAIMSENSLNLQK